MQASDMALEVVWMLTALVILATICIGLSKGILGDSIPFSRQPRDFLLDRLARYGDPFTILLMGRTYTVICSPEAIKFVLSTAHASFPVVYPVQFSRLLNPESSATSSAQVRKIILSAASGDGLRKLVPFISSLAEKTVKSWENQAAVNSVEELQKFAFQVGMHIFWRDVEPGSEEMDQIRNETSRVGGGLAAVPINFPGFSFHKALKAKQVLESRIQSEISRRRKAGIQQGDILNSLMSLWENEVTDYNTCCTMMGLLFGAFATTAALIPWVLKYLDDFPEVCQRVQVVYEIMRIESISMLIPRIADQDIDYNGVVFRKGSYVWPSNSSLHYDPKYYPNPQEFNPSRFVEKPNPNTFLPFGQGQRYCPGNELVMTETMFIIHHLVTNYSWKRCGPEVRVMHLPLRKLASFPIHLVKRCMT